MLLKDREIVGSDWLEWRRGRGRGIPRPIFVSCWIVRMDESNVSVWIV